MRTEEDIIDVISSRIGRTTLTLFVTPDKDNRYFIAESLLSAAAIFLLHRYLSGVAKGVVFGTGRATHGHCT